VVVVVQPTVTVVSLCRECVVVRTGGRDVA
jgi:hypothetical protein